MKVLYTNTAKLMGQLKVAKAKGSILQELKRSSVPICLYWTTSEYSL